MTDRLTDTELDAIRRSFDLNQYLPSEALASPETNPSAFGEYYSLDEAVAAVDYWFHLPPFKRHKTRRARGWAGNYNGVLETGAP